MKTSRTKNAARNMIFGFIMRIYQIVVPFLMRTAMIYFMGVQYLGVNSLFTSILSVLNLAELGVGSAMIYSMYKPIAENDVATVCALMRLYRFYYRIIGIFIAVIGITLTPFIPRLVNEQLPDGLNIYSLYFMYLSSTVVSYWLFAYKDCIPRVHQRADIDDKVKIITNTILYVVQFIILVFVKNYYLYILAIFFCQILNNILRAIVVTKLYPQFKPIGKLPKASIGEINKRIKALFTVKIGNVIVNSVDTIVISAFLSLTILAEYQNYYYILNSIFGLVTTITSACTAGIGNSIVTESEEKNFVDLKRLTFIICWISGFCTVCLLCLYQPFIELWVGKEHQLAFSIVICLCIYYFIKEIDAILSTYKDSAGLWHEDRFRPLVTAMLNLCINLLTVRYLGLYGVVLSTVISMVFVGIPWLMINLFTLLFDRYKIWEYLRGLIWYTMVVILVCLVTYSICARFNSGSWITFFIRLLICLVVPNCIFLFAYRRNSEFEKSVQLVNKILKKR